MNWRALSAYTLTTALCLLIALAGCNRGTTGSGKKEIEVWYHTGRPEETKVMQDQVARFNGAQKDMTVKLTLIPEGDYNTQVQAAAADDNLPDLLDLDGPYLANYAWKGHLLPLDDNLLPEKVRKDLLPSLLAQGTYDNRLYAVGTFDSGLGLYGNRKQLTAVGARLPDKSQNAWSVEEFDRLLAALAEKDADGKVLDLRLDYRGEWYTYAFSPVLQSAGGDLIERRTFQSAADILNGKASVAALTKMQRWIQKGYVDPNIDTNSFVEGRVALSWCGHWEYPRYREALGEDLVLLPLPDFGHGVRTGMGSWVWAIPKSTANPGLAMRFLLFLLQKDEVLAMANANGAVPGTRQAVAASSLYGQNGPLHLFVEQLETCAVPRPRTPAYPVITSAFQQAFRDIRNNRNVQAALDEAVAVIDQDIADNEAYSSSE